MLFLTAVLLPSACFNTEPPAPWDGTAGAPSAVAGEGGALSGAPSGGTSQEDPDGGAAGDSTGGGTGLPPLLDCGASHRSPERREQPGSTLAEVSGLAVAEDGKRLFALNDSGNRPALYGLELGGELSAMWVAPAGEPAMTLVDWEDLAQDRSRQDAPRLVIADIGDNERVRNQVVLYSVDEPTGGSSGELALRQKIELTYEDGPHDAEALLVDDRSRDFAIVTKEVRPGVYVATMPESDGTFALELVRRGGLSDAVSEFVPSGGAVSFGGGALVLRSRDRLLLFSRGSGQSLAEALAGEPCELPLAEEPQGEAVSFAPDGSYFTIGEGPSPLSFYERISD